MQPVDRGENPDSPENNPENNPDEEEEEGKKNGDKGEEGEEKDEQGKKKDDPEQVCWKSIFKFFYFIFLKNVLILWRIHFWDIWVKDELSLELKIFIQA